MSYLNGWTIESSERFNTWSIITYADDTEIELFLCNQNVHHWARAYHDKDYKIDENGCKVPKVPHTHLIVTLYVHASGKKVQRMMPSDQNTRVEPVIPHTRGGEKDALADLWDYLIHKNETEEGQYQYPETARDCDNPNYWKSRAMRDTGEQDRRATDAEFISDLLSDKMSHLEMAIKYGRDYIRNVERYEAFKDLVKHQTSWRNYYENLRESSNQQER